MLLHFAVATGLIIGPVAILSALLRTSRPLKSLFAGCALAVTLALVPVFLLTSYPLETALGNPIPSFNFGGQFYSPRFWPVGGAAVLGMAAGATAGIVATLYHRRVHAVRGRLDAERRRV